MTRILVTTFIISILALANATAAESDLAERMLACAAETDEGPRLACYDRESAAVGDASADKESAVSTQAAAATAATTASAAETASEAEAAAAVSASVVAAEPNEAELEEEFGMTRELAKSNPDYEAGPELRELNAVVVAVSKRPGGQKIVTLENGQVWVEKMAVFGFRVEVGDTILLKKGNFGGYRMVGRGRRASQVRRVE